MNQARTLLQRLISGSRRRVVGIMSGTSLDGVDVVIADLDGTGHSMSIDVVGSYFEQYPAQLAALLLQNSAPATSNVQEISQLNFRLSAFYAQAVRRACDSANIPADSLDLAGCHGQTVYHVPEAEDCAGAAVASTLQLGDGPTLAVLLGVPAVTNFRAADVALGGQGAPLVPYFDYIRFSSPTENRVLLNLGGIANITVLPAGGRADSVIAFDTGPANLLVNAVARRRLGAEFDDRGQAASRGAVDRQVLEDLLSDPYFARLPPKSTGRELFNEDYADRFDSLMSSSRDSTADAALATALELTVESIATALERFVTPDLMVDRILASGGGVRNDFLMQRLADRLAPTIVEPVSAVGIDPDFKEALCFAVFAHEFVNGTPVNLPSVTGASRPALLGELAMPG